jgi:hypothetical protein
MSVRSINEPHSSRLFNFSHPSINEPPVLLAVPEIVSIEPTEATIGDPSFTLYVTGEAFDAGTMIVFAGHGEPTTLEEDGTVSTGVNMDVWKGPDTVKVSVFNGGQQSNEVDFTFLPAAEAATEVAEPDMADPDDLEDEIEQAEEEGEFKSMHVSKTTVSVKKKKR